MVKRREFDQGLEELQQLLSEMGQRVGQSLMAAMNALKTIDVEEARRIIAGDLDLNNLETKITELGAKLIATQQPVAKDLRSILAALKISSDLERMGDLAVDIAKTTLRLEGQQLIKPLIDLPKMAELVRDMIEDAVRSYLEENVDLAYKLDKDDDEVDALYSQILRHLYLLMAKEPQTISQSMLLSFVGRYIERIADHATNIGESTVFLVTGKRPDLNT
ncbi:phosphate signaling complex protein PhoU [Cohnella pontilimi]|uniref:Phosphate-specific transport system accessory protein PhoU n=1 Tax=Cohnella pontilimi TaxID=2564100 RepID=A0A4U0F548_9BACL|nr:phosphate signaling complex protein PhoU [Cohnella pontilimi]TJY39706.1 phosphate signaling complex protein PhoU [Cohnella pontilimi]